MKALPLLATVFAICLALALPVPIAGAQTVPRTHSAQTAKPSVHQPPALAKPPAPALPLQSAQIEQKCLRALNGACTNPISVEQARLRAEIIPAVRVSYLGTPAGTVGGAYIPFERLFQDNPLVFGLPTFTLTTVCCVVRSK
jgi:hypothetical protein